MPYGTISPEWAAVTRPIYNASAHKALDEAFEILEADGKKKLTDKARTGVLAAAHISASKFIHRQEYIDGVRNPSWDDPEWGYPATRSATVAKLSRSGVSQTEEAEIVKFLGEQNWSDFAKSLAKQHASTGSLSAKQWTSAKKMKATMATKAAAKKAVVKSDKPSGIDLSELPSGYYAVPGGDTRLKVRVARPTKASKWHGWTFVSDGGEYGARKNYGRQAPSGFYQGEIQEQLQAILAAPLEAMKAYGKLHGVCGACGRGLEDETSIDLGMGPICAAKFEG